MQLTKGAYFSSRMERTAARGRLIYEQERGAQTNDH